MLKELDFTLEAIEEVNEEYIQNVAQDEKPVQEAVEYMKIAEQQHEEAYQCIHEYTRQPDMYQMQVSIFGAKCIPAIANYVLHRTAEDGCTGTTQSVEAKKAVENSFYVDDCQV